MDDREHRARSFLLFLISAMLILFSAAAVLAIVAWIPVLPEAAAVNVHPRQWMEYAYLHESWHSAAVLHDPGAALSCAK
jgi:hypothetical protein